MAVEVQFDASGPQIRAEIRCGHAQAGAYSLKLWEGNEVKKKWEGTFFDPTDDTYTLPGKAAEQEGRLLQCRFGIEIIPPITQYALIMTLWQGPQRIGVLTASGETDQEDVLKSLFAQLVPA